MGAHAPLPGQRIVPETRDMFVCLFQSVNKYAPDVLFTTTTAPNARGFLGDLWSTALYSSQFRIHAVDTSFVGQSILAKGRICNFYAFCNRMTNSMMQKEQWSKNNNQLRSTVQLLQGIEEMLHPMAT